MSDRDLTPTYIAQCPECECLVACAVADVKNPEQARDAANHAMQWVRDGLKVWTGTVQDVRTWAKPAFTHVEGCSKDRRRKKAAKRVPKPDSLPLLAEG
jgi:hypothetical protein